MKGGYEIRGTGLLMLSLTRVSIEFNVVWKVGGERLKAARESRKYSWASGEYGGRFGSNRTAMERIAKRSAIA